MSFGIGTHTVLKVVWKAGGQSPEPYSLTLRHGLIIYQGMLCKLGSRSPLEEWLPEVCGNRLHFALPRSAVPALVDFLLIIIFFTCIKKLSHARQSTLSRVGTNYPCSRTVLTSRRHCRRHKCHFGHRCWWRLSTLPMNTGRQHYHGYSVNKRPWKWPTLTAHWQGCFVYTCGHN